VKALIISADGFEDSELLVAMYRLEEAGVAVDIASMRKGRIHGQHGYEVEANKALAEVDAQQYDVLVLPGGKAPAMIRREKAALEIVRSFFRRNRPVAAICHGPQVLASAGVLRGRRATTHPSAYQELEAYCGTVVHDRVVDEGDVITARGVSSAIDAGLHVVQRIAGADARARVAAQMDYPYQWNP